MNTKPTTLSQIMKKFRRKYVLDDDWDNELYIKVPTGWKSENKEVESFFTTEIRQMLKDIVDKNTTDFGTVDYDGVAEDVIKLAEEKS